MLNLGFSQLSFREATVPELRCCVAGKVVLDFQRITMSSSGRVNRNSYPFSWALKTKDTSILRKSRTIPLKTTNCIF